ncbi:MAG: hypothetical protein K6B65_02925 [Bacilli bacterium]|nr:hypothetical protein [Bacilli bacterium]
MEVMDSTALANFLIANPDLGEEALPPRLMGMEVLSTTLSETAIILEETGAGRKAIANHLSNAIVYFDVEDATLYLMACVIYARTRFTYPECVDYVYCLIDERTPHFENRELQFAFDNRLYFGDYRR